MKPPTMLAPTTRTPLPMGRRNKRDVLAQCDKCGATGTARTRNGRAVNVSLPTLYRRGLPYAHSECGGRFRLYDIEVES